MSEHGAAGILGSFRRIAELGLDLIQNRVELFALEVQEEKRQMAVVIICAAAVAAFGLMALALLTFTVILLFWNSGRIACLVTLAFGYILAAVFTWRFLQKRLGRSQAFPETLNELKKDQACLRQTE